MLGNKELCCACCMNTKLLSLFFAPTPVAVSRIHPAKRKRIYSTVVDGEVYSFRLHQNKKLIGRGLNEHYVNGDTMMKEATVPDCIYHGYDPKHRDAVLAIIGCPPKTAGIMIFKRGHRIIYPSSPKKKEFHSLKKRGDDDVAVIANKKLVLQQDGEISHSATDKKTSSDELTIELGLFIDDALWIHFQKLYGSEADSELQTFAFAIVNNINALFRHNSLKTPIQLVVNHYEVIKVPPVEMSRDKHASGDAIRLLDLFCDYQAKINRMSTYSKRWDHALLFTGYDLYRGNVRTVAGYAPVKGMCTETRSCTISEGLDFGAVFVVAHEMGHSLGMSHDGDNGCDATCCIMSTSVGTGRTLWSPCSVRELNNFIAQLDEKDESKNCMRTLDTPGERKNTIRAGQIYTLDGQCTSFHGECWKHELKHGQHINDVCKMVWCGNGEGIIRSAHPALEYSYCGYQMWCREGRCVPATPGEAILRHGGWSDWNDSGRGGCASECVPCQIQGQIRLRRSTRICNSPFPHNGGSYCYGDDARGIRCQEEKCNGSSIEQFATDSCTKLRDSGDPSTKVLTGKGMQYEGELCKMWCVLPREQIRTTANFPDGTPCGAGRYCIKGRCRNLDCDERAVVESTSYCPPQRLFSQDREVRSRKHFAAAPNATAGRNTQHPYELWTSWSEWSSCTASTCRQQGSRVRRRACVGSVACNGSQRQRKVCYGECTANDQQWTTWSQCSASCGFGVERRVRHCPTCADDHSYIDTRVCFLKDCEINNTQWSSWGPWEPCNCTVEYRIRRRKCLHMRCKGPKIQRAKCKMAECLDKMHTSAPTWLEWGEWNACSKTCDRGVAKRHRKCSLPNGCTGLSSVYSICNDFPCK